MILYGLASCDTCRKARRALEAAGLAPVFRDVRAEPLDAAGWEALVTRFGPALVNRQSTTWRALPESDRALAPATLLAAHPAVMKRPVVIEGARTSIGWSPAARAQWGL